MRKKSTLKRMLAGILAISTALSAVPMQMPTTVLAAEEDYTSASNVQYLYEMLNYLQEGIHFLQTQIKSWLLFTCISDANHLLV